MKVHMGWKLAFLCYLYSDIIEVSSVPLLWIVSEDYTCFLFLFYIATVNQFVLLHLSSPLFTNHSYSPCSHGGTTRSMCMAPQNAPISMADMEQSYLSCCPFPLKAFSLPEIHGIWSQGEEGEALTKFQQYVSVHPIISLCLDKLCDSNTFLGSIRERSTTKLFKSVISDCNTNTTKCMKQIGKIWLESRNDLWQNKCRTFREHLVTYGSQLIRGLIWSPVS